MAPGQNIHHEEVRMNKLLAGVAALPFLSGVAFAAQPLSDRQMDTVTAGFGAAATAGAEALGGVIQTKTATLAEVAIIGTIKCCVVSSTSLDEKTLNIVKSVSASTSSASATSLTTNVPLFP